MFHILKTFYILSDIIEDSIPPAPSADFLQREMPQLSEALEKLLCYIYHDGCLGFTRSVSGNTRHHICIRQAVRMLWQDANLATELQ